MRRPDVPPETPVTIDPRPDPVQLPPTPETVRGHGAVARLRRYFLTGVVIAGPLTITVAMTWWFISLVDTWVKPIIPAAYLPESYLPFAIPGFGLVVALVGLTMLGFLTANLVGRAYWKPAKACWNGPRWSAAFTRA